MAKNRSTFPSGLASTIAAAALLTSMASAGFAQAPPAAAPGGAAPSASKAGAASQGTGPVVVPKDFAEFRIEPGDLLRVEVYDIPEYSSAYRVDPAGDLKLPLCAKARVLGLTLAEAAKLLEADLKSEQILANPQVTVDVLEYAGQYVTVIGEVASPGRIQVIAPTKLSEILAQAGGLAPTAGSRIKIRHGSDDSAPEEEVAYLRTGSNPESASVLVRPGDSVIVPRAGIVYVLGAVNRPGGYVMQEDGKLNVAEALALSGGTIMQANTGGLRVIRRNPDGTVLDFKLSYEGIAKGTQAPLVLQARDIVYVPVSKFKAVLSSSSSIIASAASAAIITTQ